jgi:phosphoglycerate dehydrogenase-like enzyme
VDYKDTIVLFTWEVRSQLKEYLQENLKDFDDVELLFPSPPDNEKLLELAPKAHIIVGWRVEHKILLAAKKMKLFINPGTGIKHHLDFFRTLNEEREVNLINGHGNSYFTAQHAVAMLFAVLNKLIPHHGWMKGGQWRRGDKDAKSIPLRGRKVGLLGYGAINQKVHTFLQGYDVEFHALKRSWKNKPNIFPTQLKTYTSSQLLEFLKEIDILIVAVPETSKTIGLVGHKELEVLGSSSILVNVSRGVVVDEESLYNALHEQKISAAAIDVWYDYKPAADETGLKFPFNYPFHELSNILLSPHRAASPFSDLKRWDEVIENIRKFTEGKIDFMNLVDLNRDFMNLVDLNREY